MEDGKFEKNLEKYQILKTKWTNGLIKLQNQLQVMGNGRKTGKW